MNKGLKQLITLTTTALLLSGCSLFSSEEDVVKMAELPVFEATYQPQIAWQKSIGSGVDKYYSQLQPTADANAVYVASRDGEVKAFSVKNGSQLWETDFSDHESNALNRSARFSGGVHLALDTLYIGTENAQVFALDKETGDLKWFAKVTGEVIASPVYSTGLVVIHTSRGDLIALDSATGEQQWVLNNKQPNLTLRGSATPAISQGGIIYGRADGFVSAALLNTGQPLWQLPVARPYGATELDRIVDADMKPVIRNGIIYTLAYNGNLVAIDLLKGTQIWERKYSGFSDIALAGASIFLSDYRGYIYAVDRSSGDEIWSNKQLAYRNVTGVTIANEYIVVGDGEGYLHWIDRDSGEFVAQQDLDSDGLYMQPFAGRDYLYLQTRSGKLIAIEKPSINKK
ncbi:outer membrane protein assembly factor BamB [Psychromonas sp. psych-6C06]|uniref:outer membrane protein assembly factor BamB n=1 Tax=Psychromonas sp. psych-6C06 TaxID=2058089 RepID=UPI000C3277CF|nr:outer membrane protein assembly factor BamB [Psychromonas sp. psych-6C06]PKF63470.1 outer membrane protein assembly factor BamB [Psychromonas sp. psych-6C06]